MFIELTQPLRVGATFHARRIVNPFLPLDCTMRRVEPGGGIAVSFEVPEESGKAQPAAILAASPQV